MTSVRYRRAAILTAAAILIGLPAFAQQSQDAQQQNSSSQAAAQTSQQQTQEPEQSRESMAVDSTASQWSFQGAWEGRPSYHQDEISSGVTRPKGSQGFFQFRAVVPIAPSKYIPFTILPRVTFRRTQIQGGDWGGAPVEIFALLLPFDWGTGRAGAGPLVRIPSSNERFGSKAWQYGFSAAIVQRALSDKIFFGLLVSQAWGKTDPSMPTNTLAQPIAINPILTVQLGKGFYVANGEQVGLYNWQKNEFYLPLAVRFGYVLVQDSGSWNIYGEYKTSGIYKGWSGSALKHGYRINVSYTIPVG